MSDEVETQEQEPSLRDAIVAATEQSETPEALESAESPVAAVAEAGEVPEVKSETKGAQEEQKQGLERDGKGKFQKKSPASQETAPTEEATQLAKSRAPSSWRPALREKWTALPAEVQAEVLKREREIGQGFNEIGEIKKFRDSFLQTINPYQNIFQAEGGQPMQTITNLLQTAGVLYNGAPMQKAQTVAQMIKSFGIDVRMLDELLSGQPPTQGQGQGTGGGMNGGPDISRLVQNAVQSALAPVLRGQQEAAQREEEDAVSAIDQFAQDPKNEFFEDVKDEMADLLEMAAKRGQKMDLSTAYNRAILAHSDIADIVSQRKLQERTSAASSAAAAARRKAVSITGAPANESANPGNSIRDALNNAIETLGA